MSSSEEYQEEEVILDDEPDTIASYISDADTICAICHAEFLDPDDLSIHINQVHKSQRYELWKCQFCTEGYRDAMEYAEHIRDDHISSLTSCSYCWRLFDQEEACRKHYKKHIKNKIGKTFKCSQCPQRYTELLLLKKHEYEYHENIEGIMLHEIFPYLSAALKVKSVTFIESLGSDVVYICVGCSFSTVDIQLYLEHVKSGYCKVFVCYKCGSVFNKKKNISKHTQSSCDVFGIKEKPTRLCLDCNTNIATAVYAKHKIRCKAIKCYICDIKFKNMNEWSEHQAKVHTGTSVVVQTCRFCWKRCVGSVALKRHIDKTHKQELHLYKYLCVYCKDIFKHPQKLFAHFVTQHKDLMPYTCKICNKEFRFRKKFTIHIKLVHKSQGFVEFDKNYHVFFADKKSENPFIPKSIYNDDNDDEDKLDFEFMNITETEGNQTEIEVKEKPKLKRKRNTIRKNENIETTKLESSDDSEPLLTIRKRVRLQKKILHNSVIKKKQPNKSLLTCKVCNKYCYTQQNYQHHVSLHSKNEVKKCIKCGKNFKSKSKLNEHISIEHSSSKLTETLKTLLEKRKTGGSLTDDLPMSEKFRRTIKKVTQNIMTSSATITPVNEKLSVQKFLENFVPEENKINPIETTATINIVAGIQKEPTIKLTKFKETPIKNTFKLAMPVKFTDHYSEKVNLTINLVDPPQEQENYYSEHSNNSPDIERNESIPDVAEEVMLENSEDDQKVNKRDIGHKLILPKLQVAMNDIKIAHLLPQAPYYKIVKAKDVLGIQNESKEEVTNAQSSIKLPDGTKLVTTNPLAHLLGNNSDKIMGSFKSNYYKSKNRNIQSMLAKALTMLDKPTPQRKKKNVTNNE